MHEASRISPTNIGMLLNARQAACELGFITTPEFADLTSKSLATIARLKKFRGHLYNWYDTQTLQAAQALARVTLRLFLQLTAETSPPRS